MIMNPLSYLVLYLCFHACFARPLMVSTKDAIAKHHHTKVVQFFDQGKKALEVLFSRKILQQPTGAEKWKRADRSTMEKSSSEKVGSKDRVEDIDVMDYAQPHRKPPIHNWGT